MNYFFILLIAISLSMDAFSLALSVGTFGLENRYVYILSSAVGVFHFFMPLLGSILGSIFMEFIHIDAHFLSSVIFSYIAFMMFKDFKSGDRESFNITLVGIIVFALSVSMDSFGIGFALNDEEINHIISFLIFTICSFSFTFIGLKFGRVLKTLIGAYSELIGALIMGALALLNFCQFLF